MFLKRDNDENVNDEYTINIIGVDEIKTECCEENFDCTPYDVFNPPLTNDEESNENVDTQSQSESQFEFLTHMKDSPSKGGERHQKIHLNAKYKRKHTKKIHKYRTSSTRKQVYRCVLCVPQIVFASSYERDTHKNFFHRNFECDVCKNSFMSQETLNSHKLRHSDEPRPFVCTVSKVFIQALDFD